MALDPCCGSWELEELDEAWDIPNSSATGRGGKKKTKQKNKKGEYVSVAWLSMLNKDPWDKKTFHSSNF